MRLPRFARNDVNLPTSKKLRNHDFLRAFARVAFLSLSRHRTNRLQMHIALWIRNGNPRLLEAVLDREVDIRLNVANTFLGVGQPNAQLQRNTAVSKFYQADHRFRCF